jgi:thiosulfate reductase cytochrome b subunit
MDAFYDVKNKLNVPFAMEIIILAPWVIWIVRNNKNFKNQRPSFEGWKTIYKSELRMIQLRMKKKMQILSENGYNHKCTALSLV